MPFLFLDPLDFLACFSRVKKTFRWKVRDVDWKLVLISCIFFFIFIITTITKLRTYFFTLTVTSNDLQLHSFFASSLFKDKRTNQKKQLDNCCFISAASDMCLYYF